MHYLFFYDVSADYVERRVPLRDEHSALAWAAQADGRLILADALADPVDGAVLLFEGESAAGAEEFARADPYVRALTRWHVRPWTTVVGEIAVAPAHPPRDRDRNCTTTYLYER
jgi:uncharacterized protein YciI